MRQTTKEHYINPEAIAFQINRISDLENAARKEAESKIKWEPANALNQEHSDLMKRITRNTIPEDNTYEIRQAEYTNSLMSSEDVLHRDEQILGQQFDDLIKEMSQDFADKD